MRDGINIKNANYITNVVFSHELVGLKKIILHERSSFYLGIGIGGNLFYQSSLGNPKDGNTYQHNYNIKLPLGVELFLSKAHNVSVGIESRIETQFDFQTLYDPYLPGTYEVNFSGLMEITYYFSKKEVKN